MILHHEDGGDPESDLIKDADSISYFEMNSLKHANNAAMILGMEKTRNKLDWMYNRISSEKAKKIAKPMYEKALKALVRALP